MSLSDRIYSLAEKNEEEPQKVMLTYLKLEARIYFRECEKHSFGNYEDTALSIMERYTRIQQREE